MEIFFNSRNWFLLPADVQFRLQQHRHYGIDVWASVQNLKRLDIIVRELVSEYYEVHKILGTREPKPNEVMKNPWGLYVVLRYSPDDANHIRRKLWGVRIFLAGKKLYHEFDTHEKYISKSDSSGNDEIINVRMKVCSKCGNRTLLDRSPRRF